MDKVDQHELRSRLIALASSLGRTPKRDEFISSGVKRGWIDAVGGWAALIAATGLEPHRDAKITNAVFERPIEKHLEEYEPRPVVERGPWPAFASISDIHWPFANQRVVDRFHEYVGDKKPEWVLLNGDAWDMFAHGKFPRSHNVFTPREEERLSRQANEEFWREVRRRAPAAKCVQLMGNHDIRPLKRILEEYPSAEDWVRRELERLFTFEGIRTIHDHREELMLAPDIAVFHGYRSKLGDHRDYTLMNTVNGHTHLGGVVYRRIRGQTLWELNSGMAGDPEAKGLTYTPQKITHWTPGFGACDKYGPRFIPV